MGLNWLLALSFESSLYAIIIWLGIGYLNTFILRFLLRVPCRFDGDELEESNFDYILFLGPLGLSAIPVILINEAQYFISTTLPYLREQRRIAKTKALPVTEEIPPPTHLM